MATRLYVVRVISGAQVKEYLVDAGTQAAARLHVAKKHVEVKIADGPEIVKLMQKGIQPESAVVDAGGEQQELPETGPAL
jgi:hypothetical protein